jgi:DUF4097 and DUF4098 domain-containing protein YvlB
MTSHTAHERSSIFAGLLLILLGLLFFANRFYPTIELGQLIRLYWPLLIILWGVAKLIDHLTTRPGEKRAPILSGGEAALLVFLAIVLGGFVFRDWVRDIFPNIVIDVPSFGAAVARQHILPPVTLAEGASVVVEAHSGNVSIAGDNGTQLRVTALGSKDAEIALDHGANVYRVRPTGGTLFGRSTLSLDVQVPRGTPVSLSATHGDISASAVAASIRASGAHGNIDVRDAGSDVFADLRAGDVRMRNVAGNVQIRGRGDDIDLANVVGSVTIEGGFSGEARLHNIGGALRVRSLHSTIEIAQLPGDLKFNSGNLSITKAVGPVEIGARDQDVNITATSGPVNISGTHGNMRITYVAPLQANLSVTSDSGDVDVFLPARSYFQLDAAARSGQVQCDFAQAGSGEDDGAAERLSGTFGVRTGAAPAAKISLATSYGTIRIHKEN